MHPGKILARAKPPGRQIRPVNEDDGAAAAAATAATAAATAAAAAANNNNNNNNNNILRGHFFFTRFKYTEHDAIFVFTDGLKSSYFPKYHYAMLSQERTFIKVA